MSQAFDILKTSIIDLIIMALADNKNIIQALTDSEFENIPILILTSTDDMKTREKLFRLGISDYILKNQITKQRLKSHLESYNKYKGLSIRGEKLKIAVLDDSKISLNVIKKIFHNSAFTNISYYSKGKDLLVSDEFYDIYIIDLVLEEMTGEEVMQEIRNEYPQAIIIIASSIDHNRTISNMLLNGADDFLVKPFNRNIFIARIKAHIRTYFLRIELEEKNIILKNMMDTDGLTGVYTHKYTMEALEDECNRTDRYHHDLSVAMIDIDFFKNVNDSYGHPIGDEILIEIGMLLKKHTRKTDIVGRYGGEEFIIIFIECNLESAKIATEKIRKIIEEYNFPYIDKLTISGGISKYTGQEVKELVSEADKNLYKAKEFGRNKIV
jgi:two-component system cell cycle response regulator